MLLADEVHFSLKALLIPRRFLNSLPKVKMDKLLYNFPAMAPPPGVQPNFDNPHSLKKNLVVVNALFLPLMASAVGIRLYVRIFIARAPGWDDCGFDPSHADRALIKAKMDVSEPPYVHSSTRHGGILTDSGAAELDRPYHYHAS